MIAFVQVMIGTQDRIRKIVEGFAFNLGFSGKNFRHGTEEENQGDDELIGTFIDETPKGWLSYSAPGN